MSAEPLFPDYIPDELIDEQGGEPLIRRRSPRRATDPRPTRHLTPAPDVQAEAVAARARRTRQREDAAIVLSIELGLFGLVAIALWWTSLASSSESWLWTAFAYGGWVVAFHLPALLAVVVLRAIERRGR